MIAVDLDGTLAHYVSGQGVAFVGAPIPRMVERVRGFLADGEEVCIFTARMSEHDANTTQRPMIEAWCREHLGRVLEVTATKRHGMKVFYDDRAVGVVKNTGMTESELVRSDEDCVTYHVDGSGFSIEIEHAFEECDGTPRGIFLDGAEARTLAARLLRAADAWEARRA